ncbi:hypothetical protein [Micromonospora haikouensis]|uniref:hypothetical protein n=1 Tax=Micromonospora haikouensis TaxID=686309 RepID=UPI003D90F606
MFAVIGAPSPASAAATAYNTKSSTLAGNPSDGMATICLTKDIALASGTYKWGYVMYGTNYDSESRNISLAAGTYKWTQCIDPKDGFYNLSGKLQVIVDTDPLPPAYLPEWAVDIGSNTTMTWGGYLDPAF